jgi:threonyl-tRNA synthetase
MVLHLQQKNELNTIWKCWRRPKNATTASWASELDLFTFSELVGAGLPLFTPRGTVLREKLAAIWRAAEKGQWLRAGGDSAHYQD